jgi:hypothetical protein
MQLSDNVILYHNYFQLKDKFYKTPVEVAMRSPVSEFTAEIFLQYYENLIMKHIMKYNHIISYITYVVDSSITYDQTKITYNQILVYLFTAVFSLNPHTKQMLLSVFGRSFRQKYTGTRY